jgi:hypothetical protein
MKYLYSLLSHPVSIRPIAGHYRPGLTLSPFLKPVAPTGCKRAHTGLIRGIAAWNSVAAAQVCVLTEVRRNPPDPCRAK